MSEWIELLKSVGISVGILLIVLAWMTNVLIPRLQAQLDAALVTFKTELTAERETHERINQTLMERNQRIMEELIDHFKTAHVVR